MASRRVLVFDDDSAFLALLEHSLAAYGFEVRALKPQLDEIRTARVFNPEAIFIAVDAPDTIGYTLCNKARVAVGKRTRIILATATLPPDDFASHQKLKLHADLYLDKRNLSRDDLLKKLDDLIGLGPRIGQPVSDADEHIEQPPFFEDDDEFDMLDGPNTEHGFEPVDSVQQKERNGATPVLVAEYIDEANEGHGETDGGIASQTASTSKQMIAQEATGYNDLDRRLTEQETELSQLRQQLEEARREARSSPFSKDFLKLRERVVQKDLEITLLTEKLHDINSEIHAGKNSFEELNRTVIGLSTEINQGLKREEKLTALLQVRQREVAQLRDQHAAAIEQVELDKHSALESVRKLTEEELAKTEAAHRQALHTIEANYAAQLAQLRSETNAEVETLQQQTTHNRRRAADILDQEKQAHQQTRQQAETMIAQLQDQHAAALKEAELEKRAALESARKLAEEELTKTEDDKRHALNTLETKYATQLTQVQFEKDAEIERLKQQATEHQRQTADMLAREEQAHEQTRRQSEATIAQLQDEHAAALKQAEREKRSSIESIQKLADENVRKAEEVNRRALHTLETNHAAQLAQIQSERDNVELIKQKASEELRQTAESLARERHAHGQTRQQSEATIAQLQHQYAAGIKQAELDKRSALDSARKLAESELTQAEKDHRHTLHALKTNYTTQLAQLQSNRDAEIETLNKKAIEEQLQTSDMLVREKQAHQQTRQLYDKKLVQLQAAIKESEKEWLNRLRVAEEKHKSELLEAEARRTHDLLNLERAIFDTRSDEGNSF